MKKKSLGINAVLNGIRSVLTLLFPLITFPYVSRILGATGIGIYNFSNSIVSYFLLIAGLGINTYAVREGAKYRENKEKISEFSSQIFTINLCSTVIAYILLGISLIIFKELQADVICILIFSMQIVFTTIGVEWLYTIYEDYTYITIRSIIFNILSILLLFLFVRKPSDYLIYAGITVCASAGANILNFINSKKIINLRITTKLNLAQHIKPILIIFASSVAVMIYVNSDITLLGLMKNNYVVGIYSVSAKIYTMVKSVLTAILIVTVPRLALLWGQKRFKEYKSILKDVVNNLIILVLPTMLGLMMLSREVILIISGKSFLRAHISLEILCVALIFSLFGWIISDCVLIPAKREKYFLFATVLSAVLNIAINILFIPSFSENAAAFSTVIAEGSMVIINLYYARDIMGPIFKSRNFLKNLLSAVIGCLGIVIVCLLLKMGIKSLILRTILSVILSIIMYGAILVLLKNDIAINILSKVYERFK